MHPLMSLWREGWSSLHPNWTMKLWSECRGQVTALECNGEILDSSFPTQLQGSCNLSQRTNIWRYELLERFGGLYLDTDFEPVKNIEPIIKSSESFAGLGLSFYPGETQMRANCALIGCTPHHPWTQICREHQDPRSIHPPEPGSGLLPRDHDEAPRGASLRA